MTGIVKNEGAEFLSMFDGNEYNWKPGQEREFPLPVANWFVQKHKQLKITGRYGGGLGAEIVRPKGFTLGVEMPGMQPAGPQKPTP